MSHFEEIISEGPWPCGRHRVVDAVECADGATISVQASEHHYCSPRDDKGPYTAVEVGFPTARPDWWDEYAEEPHRVRDGAFDSVAGWVPVELVREFIEQHGGEA